MTLDSQHKAFQDYIQGLTGLKVANLDPKGPQMNEAYVATKIFSVDLLDYDIETISDDPGSEEINSTMRGMARVEFQIQAIGGSPWGTLKRIKNSFNSAVFLDKLSSQGFGYSECSDIIDISIPLTGSRYESRSQMSCHFYMSVPENFNIDHFDKIDVTTNIEEQGISRTQTIPEQE